MQWVNAGHAPDKSEVRGKSREVLVARSKFSTALFKMSDGVLMYTNSANGNQLGEVGRICIPESMVKEVWSLCHQSDSGGHRGIDGTLDKFNRGFFMLSPRPKMRYLNEGCDTCITKERSVPSRVGEHVPSLTGYVGEKLYIDLVSMSDTVRGNRYLLTVEDSFSRYCRTYPIPNKEAKTVAKVLMDQHFNIFGLPDQLHSDNGREFVNNLWKELFSELKVQHTTTPPYNPSSNPVERFHRTIIAILRTRGEGIQENWDLWINASVFAYNTTVSSSTGVTPHYAMFGREATLPVDWVFPTPSVDKRTMYQWNGDMIEERQRAYRSMRAVQRGRVRRNAQLYKPLTQNIRVGCLVWYYDARVILATSHKLRSFWAGPYRVDKLIAPALAEIKPVYYPGEVKLVNLDVLKLYRGEDVVRQNPDDVDPDHYADEGDLTELPEIPLVGPERRYSHADLRVPVPEIPQEHSQADLRVPVPEIPQEHEKEVDSPDTPEDIAEREGIHERIQAELRNRDKEEMLQAEEMLELPPVWNEVQDLLMEDETMLPGDIRPGKRVRDEPARGRRKRRNEEDIRADKRAHSPTETQRNHHPQGYYEEDWIDDQQAEDDYQNPEKFRRIANMVFLHGVLGDPPVQHQGGGCSQYDVDGRVILRR